MPQTPRPVTNPHSAVPGWIGSEPPRRSLWQRILDRIIRLLNR